MKLRDPRVWIALVSLVAILMVGLSDLTRTAPGPLSHVHGRIPELNGMGSCSQCHGGWFGNMATSCLACHGDVAAQIEKNHGLHGTLGAERASRCAVCHSEHHGPDFGLVNRISFARAGIPDPKEFDHSLIGYPMAGRHLELSCDQCHLHAETQPLPQGERRFLGLSQDCASCHHDPHQGQMQLKCTDCHGQHRFTMLESQDHHRMALVGPHKDLDCRQCHADDGPHALLTIGPHPAVSPGRSCADCHDSPHRDGWVAGVARMERVSVAAACALCHEEEHRSFADAVTTLRADHHGLTGFPLSDAHGMVSCDRCHQPERVDYSERHPGRLAGDCRACHEDVHKGAFDNKPFAANGCVDCHSPRHFLPHGFTVERHRETAFTLHDSHAGLACSACHQPDGDGPLRFAGTPKRCEACHSDAHDGHFHHVREELEKHPGGTCAVCHKATTFKDVAHQDFDHLHFTGFALKGAHLEARCEACHPRSITPDAHGRCFGRAVSGSEPARCGDCHQDPHEGAFDRPGFARTVQGKTSCARCHVESSFRAFTKAFEHGTWTGFSLQGAHGRLDCSACHERIEPDAVGRTWQRAKGRECADCHQDPHAGQFAVAGQTDCRPCHQGGSSFQETVFRHDVHSRFRLGEQHAQLACVACHKTFQDGARAVVRYRPLPTRCVDCHGQNESPLQRRTGGGR